MATITKKDLLEAIEDMPMDAEILIQGWDMDLSYIDEVEEVKCDKTNNEILLC